MRSRGARLGALIVALLVSACQRSDGPEEPADEPLFSDGPSGGGTHRVPTEAQHPDPQDGDAAAAPPVSVWDAGQLDWDLDSCQQPLTTCSTSQSVHFTPDTLQETCFDEDSVAFSAYCEGNRCLCSRAGVAECTCSWLNGDASAPQKDQSEPTPESCCFEG